MKIKHGEKYIIFEYQTPTVVYGVHCENDIFATVSEEWNTERLSGGWVGKIVNKNLLQPYTPQLWAACMHHSERRQQTLKDLRQEYNELKNGVVRLL